MKNLLFILGFITFPLLAGAQTTTKLLDKPDTTKKVLIVEASCGQCKFGLPGMGCSLAVRIDGQAYYVNGTNIDSHGDSHAKDGFCAAIRTAEVQGELINNEFSVSYFKLQKKTIKKNPKK